MFIRKKKNKGGSNTILLVIGERVEGKKHPVLRIVKNFGSATTTEELDKLLLQAEEYKCYLLRVSPKAKSLKITSDSDLKSCRSYNIGFLDVYGAFFDNVFHSLKMPPKLLNQIKTLTIMRIAKPVSKRKTAIVAPEYNFNISSESIYKIMDQLTEDKLLSIKKIIYQESKKIISHNKETVDVLFYDLTTLSFETNTQDELRNFGFSKDGKHQHVQIMLAIIVTTSGLPIDYEEFPGNSFEGHTLLPVIEKIQNKYNISEAVLVADAALMNKINLESLAAKNIKYIISARIKNTKKELKEKIIDLENYENVSVLKNKLNEIEDEVKAKKIDLENGDILIAYYSSKRARKDSFKRGEELEKIKNYVNSTSKNKLTSRLRKPYVKVNKSCQIEIDENKLQCEAQYDGLFGLHTNITTKNPKELLSAYRGLWQVEQTFRIAKSSLKIRPVFHYTPKRIKSHFILCYMALALVRYVEYKLKMSSCEFSWERLHLLLQCIKVVEVRNANGELFEFLEDLPLDAPSIYQALNIKLHKKFSYKPGL